MVTLNKSEIDKSLVYTLFDKKEKVIIGPTKYLNRLRKNNRPETSQKLIANVIKLHCEWIENLPYFEGLSIDESLSIIISDDIVDWINYQRRNGCSEVTIHNREILLRQMYEWFLTEEAGVRRNIPWGPRLFTKSQHNKIPRSLSTEQVIALLQGMHNESQRAAAHFLFDTGVRISEMIRLNCSDLPHVDEDVNYYSLRVKGSKAYDGSDYKYRETIISKPMLSRIRRYHANLNYKLAKGWDMRDPNKPVFLNTHGSRLTAQSVYNTIKSAWKRQLRNPEEVSPHKLRHGTAYSVLRSEFGNELLDSLIILRGMLGHENIQTTEIYGSIPMVTLQRLTQRNPLHLRYEEADEIYQKTYLAEYKNTQKRGRKNDKSYRT